MTRLACALFLLLTVTAACTQGEPPNPLSREIIGPEVIKQLQKEAEEQKKALEARQKKQQEELKSLQWISYGVLWFVIALAGAFGGGWGARQVLARKSPPAAPAAPPRVDCLGLGADGKGGVWLREGPPWEE
jgi:hypothetical protein